MKNAIRLLLFAVTLSLATNHFSPSGIPLFGQWDQSQGVVRANVAEQSAADVFEIDDIEAAKQIYDQGSTVFIDARSAEAYIEGHIRGALSLPVWESEARIDEFLNMYTPDQPIVVYCSGRTCEDSHRLSVMLFDAGYRDVSVMIDGFPGWEQRGFPIDR